MNMKSHLAVIATVILAGCGQGPESSFTYREATQKLMREAQDGYKNEAGEKVPGLKTYMVDLFGTPDKLVAWQRLPIDFGGYPGTTLESAESGPTRSFKVDFAAEELGFAADQPFELIWTSGDGEDGRPQAYSVWKCLGYDPESQEIKVGSSSAPEFEGSLPTTPPAGMTFIVDPGRNLRGGRKLYSEHCMHCHGMTGDGQGPTAKYLNPLPRDYRLGKFKFRSVKGEAKVARADLHRTIKYGLPGTYMPSFLLLTEQELNDVTEYVRFLAMRGELEFKAAEGYLEPYSNSEEAKKQRQANGEDPEEVQKRLREYLSGTGEEGNFAEDIDSEATFLVEAWKQGEDAASQIVPTSPRPPMTKSSIDIGRELFLGAKAKCSNCHGISGRGDGPQTKELTPENRKLKREPGLYDDWGHPLKPRNLTAGIYRGGRRPIDIFRRIKGGIQGAVMPAIDATIPDEQVWHLVNYVLSIPLDPADVVDEPESDEGDTDEAPEEQTADAVKTNANESSATGED